MLIAYSEFEKLLTTELGTVSNFEGGLKNELCDCVGGKKLKRETFYAALRSFAMIRYKLGLIKPNEGQKVDEVDFEASTVCFNQLFNELDDDREKAFDLMMNYRNWVLSTGVELKDQDKDINILKREVYKMFPPCRTE